MLFLYFSIRFRYNCFFSINIFNKIIVNIIALTHFTQFSSSEFAVRPYIIKYQKQMINQHLIWSKHKNYHVRRLASEGIRPRLPWAMALLDFKKDPSPIIPILNNLMADEQEYVRRSVANCINDISKDHPQIVIDLVKNNINKSTETDKLLKHASRGLLKKGNAEILKLFGLNNEHLVNLLSLQIDKLKIQIGKSFNFTFSVQLQEKVASQVRLEYNIYYVKANGKQSAKIFQIGTYLLQPNQTVEVNKKHSFINLTTRKHYAGMHKIAIVANGNEIGFLDFELLV